MTIPPLLIGVTLLIWGWRVEALAFAIPMALVVEAARLVPWRWQLSDTDFNRVADLSTVGFIVLAVYQFDEHSVRGIYFILRWLPTVLFLLVALQLYSTHQRVSYTALFLSVRRAVKRGTLSNPDSVDMRIPYLVLCLVSAGAAPVRDLSFYGFTCLVIGMLLWANRPVRYGPRTWAMVAGLALAAGYFNVQGVLETRRLIAPLVMEYFQDRVWTYRDPYRAYTAMGYIGRLKRSDRIVMRVKPSERWGAPSLLREASYQTYSRTLWLAGRSEFQPLKADGEGTAWGISQGRGSVRQITITRTMRSGKGLLAVPNGTFMVDELPVEDLYRNPLGVLKVLKGPELVEYRAHYTPERTYLGPPGPSDLSVPADVEELIGDLAAHLALGSGSPAEALARVQRYFNTHFEYSVELVRPQVDGTPLHDFLLRGRRGHCEFFASSAVLLLRAAGIPARYATGFSVQEWSELESAYLVRRRHAHSWALAYIDGRWQDFDATPPVWGPLEAEQAPWWQDLYDFSSWLGLFYSRWRWGSTDDESSNAYLLWLILPLGVVLAWRLYLTERVTKTSDAAGAMSAGDYPGRDSELYQIERLLHDDGLERNRGESLRSWFARLDAQGRLPLAELILGRVLPAHYRYRFDPIGIAPADREALRAAASRWLQSYQAVATRRS